MTIKFITFVDEYIGVNPDQVVYVQAGLGHDEAKTWIHFTGNNQPIKVNATFTDVMELLEHNEDEEGKS